MNERIRYRQWNNIIKDWHIWGLIDNKFVMPIIVRSDLWDKYSSFQSTGLRDSTRTKEFPEGKEIWEGDIMSIFNTNAVVRQDKDGLWILDDGSTKIPQPLAWALERYKSLGPVIGDTTTTPGLMEVRK